VLIANWWNQSRRTLGINWLNKKEMKGKAGERLTQIADRKSQISNKRPNWQLAIGNRQSAIGNWQLAIGIQHSAIDFEI